MTPEQTSRLNELLDVVKQLIVVLEEAPNHLTPLAQEPAEVERIKQWNRDVVSKVKEGLVNLSEAAAGRGWLAHKRRKKALDFFARFPSIYGDLFFAQWSTKEKEIDDLFDKVFALADSLS